MVGGASRWISRRAAATFREVRLEFWESVASGRRSGQFSLRCTGRLQIEGADATWQQLAPALAPAADTAGRGKKTARDAPAAVQMRAIGFFWPELAAGAVAASPVYGAAKYLDRRLHSGHRPPQASKKKESKRRGGAGGQNHVTPSLSLFLAQNDQGRLERRGPRRNCTCRRTSANVRCPGRPRVPGRCLWSLPRTMHCFAAARWPRAAAQRPDGSVGTTSGICYGPPVPACEAPEARRRSVRSDAACQNVTGKRVRFQKRARAATVALSNKGANVCAGRWLVGISRRTLGGLLRTYNSIGTAGARTQGEWIFPRKRNKKCQTDGATPDVAANKKDGGVCRREHPTPAGLRKSRPGHLQVMAG